MKHNSTFLYLVLLFMSTQSFGQNMLMDLIPINTATHTAIQSGSWFDAATWDTGTIPSDAAIVIIPSGLTVSYQGESDSHIFAIRVDGTFTATQTNASNTTRLIFDTFIGTHMSKAEFLANNASDGYLDIQIKPFDIEAHKAGTSGYPQVWNADAISHFSDGATTYQVTYDIGPDKRFKNYADALNGNTSVTELTRETIEDGAGILGRHEWDATHLSIGLVTMGEIEIIGQAKSVMARLSVDARKDETSIHLETIPAGWEVGDEILVTRGGNQGESSAGTETAIIQSMTGNTITTAASLTKNHGGRPADDLHCYVGNLDRNIKFYSSNPDVIQHRGHLMVMHNPNNIQIKNAAFIDMGRTDKSRLLDDLLWSHWVEPVVFQSYVSALGQECSQLVAPPKEDITNHRGRYSIHLHQTGAINGTNLAQVTGNVVRGNPGWGITHHDAHANVSDNVVYDVTGSGIVSEFGNETGFWDNNLVVDIKAGHNFDFYLGILFYGDYLFGGQGLGMKGRGVICRGNVIVEAERGVGVVNSSSTKNITKRMDSEALASFRPDFMFDQFPLDKNGYSKEGDGVIPTEIPLIMENTTSIWCSQGINSIERDPGVNHESRSIFDGFKVWGANWGLRINYQADYSFRDVFISGKNSNSEGIVMYKHASNMIYERIKFADLGYAVVASKLHNAGTDDVRTRNTRYTPWLFIDAETENVDNMYYVTYQDLSDVPYTEHPDNPIHLSSAELFSTRPITFTLNDASDLEIDLATSDLQFRVDGAVTDKGGTYEFGVTQAASMDALRVDYDERIYEFASQAKLEEYITNNAIYKDESNNDQLYIIINEYVPDRITYEYKAFPIRVNIMNAPNTGVFANPQVEDAANLEPKLQLLSRFATAKQSSTSTTESFADSTSITGFAKKAIDGNNNGRPNVGYYQQGLIPVGSAAVTEVELEPWWEMDLGENQIIEYIDLWNTVEMQGQDIETPSPYFRNFYVLIADAPFTANMSLADARAHATQEYYKDGYLKRLFSINQINVTGRYIRIQAEGFTQLRLAEVDVLGRAISTNPDCNGDANGLAYLDECGTCVEGNTGLAPCELDCVNVWGGTAYFDNCGTCVGGTTGETAATEIPCNGIDDDCDPLTLDAEPADDMDGDGVCDMNDLCDGLEPGTACDKGLSCISDYTINDDCNCVGVASTPTGFTNLALNKPTSQSSIRDGLGSERAVDGNTDGNMANGSVTYTNFDTNAWWEVDLESVEDIGIINLYNRTDCCLNRLVNFYVFVSDVPFVSTSMTDVQNQSGVSAYYFTDKPDSNISIAINRTGQYVRVQLNHRHFLSLAEVEVIELCTCMDTDGDGVCDENDLCEGSNDKLDADNDGIPDGCDTCDNNLEGTPCDDGLVCTYNDIIQADCSCMGTAFELECTVLATELLLLQGQLIDQQTFLEWQISTQQDVKGFEIQRSRNNHNWETLGFIEAEEMDNFYNFWDKQPYLNYNYYRLKIVNLDGTEKYSNTISIRLTGGALIKVYPNPTTNQLYIDVELTYARPSKNHLCIFDALGKLVAAKIVETEEQGFKTRFDLTSLSSGIYLLKIENGLNVITKKIVKE